MKTKIRTLGILCSLLFITTLSIAQSFLANGEVNFLIAGQEVQVPSNKVSFAKKIDACSDASSDTLNYRIWDKRIIGFSPDKPKKVIEEFVKLRKGEFVVFKFIKNGIKDVMGTDLYVFAEGLSENSTVLISKNGQDWIEAGEVNQRKKYIDLSGRIEKGAKFSYLKLLNQSDQTIQLYQVAALLAKTGSLGKQVEIENDMIYAQDSCVYLKLKDRRHFDGDMISIKINGETFTKRKLLTKWSEYVKISLRPGSNTIVIKAKNEGLRKPNTINISIVDGVVFHVGEIRLKKNQYKTIEIIGPD